MDRGAAGASARAAQRFEYDADGNPVETFIAGDMDCNGVVNGFDLDGFILALGSMPPNYPEYYAVYPDCDVMNADVNGDGAVNGFDTGPFIGLMGTGNAGVARQRYEWDAENRLTKIEPAADPQEGDLKVEFAYDYQGRRVEKVVLTWTSGTWQETFTRRYIWDGWLMLLEIDGEWDAVLRTYTWGLDLSRDREGAGGIGGLLSVEDATIQGGPGEYTYFYDANGNVGQLVAWETGYGNATGDEWHADRLVARYEYDPYGNRTNEPAPDEPEQPFRFSTHQLDPETGLLYAKNRYYSARLGRFMSRDPIAEPGAVLGRRVGAGQGFLKRDPVKPALRVYGYVANDPTNHVDPKGLCRLSLETWLGIRCCGCFVCRTPSTVRDHVNDSVKIGYGAADDIVGRDRSNPQHRAIRHCVASGYLATKVGCWCAECIGTGREHYQTDCQGQSAEERDRGLFNNYHGRKCAWCQGGAAHMRPTLGTPKRTLEQIKECCKKKLEQGVLHAKDDTVPDLPWKDD